MVVPGKTIKAAYKKRFNSDPLTYAASMYDGLILLAKAMQKANSIDPKKYKPVLAALSYQGVAGSYAFDDMHDLKNSPISVYAFRNGQLVALN